MKIKNPMLVVTDIDKSVEFYKKVFGLHVIMDFGANKTLTGGLALQAVETWKKSWNGSASTSMAIPMTLLTEKKSSILS